MMKLRLFLPVIGSILLCLLCGCSELYELREIKTMQDQRIQELENKNYNLKVEKEKEQIKYTGEMEKQQKEIADLKEKRSEREQTLSDENFSLRRNIQTLENKVDTTQNDLKKQNEEFVQYKDKSQSNLDQKLNDIKGLEDDKASLANTNSDLKSRIAKLEEQIAENDKIKSKMEKQLTERDSLVSDLTTQLNDIKAQMKNQELASQRKTSSEKDGNASITPLLSDMESKMKKDLAPEIIANKINVKQNGKDLIIRLYSDDLFEKGSVIIADDVKPLLRRISTLVAQSLGFEVYVEGHTDNTPIQNLPFLDNLALSSARSDNILRFMIEDGGVDRKRVRSVACSWFHPVATNDTPEGRRENRRVEIVLKPE